MVNNQDEVGGILVCIEQIKSGDCFSPGYETYFWYDDGSNGDLIANDGIYSDKFFVNKSKGCNTQGEIVFINPYNVLSNTLEYEYIYIGMPLSN